MDPDTNPADDAMIDLENDDLAQEADEVAETLEEVSDESDEVL